jgi:hypothetical protein
LRHSKKNKVLEECDKEENMGVTAGCCFFLFEKKILKLYSCSSQYKDGGRAKELKNWDSSACRVPRKSFAVCSSARVP